MAVWAGRSVAMSIAGACAPLRPERVAQPTSTRSGLSVLRSVRERQLVRRQGLAAMTRIHNRRADGWHEKREVKRLFAVCCTRMNVQGTRSLHLPSSDEVVTMPTVHHLAEGRVGGGVSRRGGFSATLVAAVDRTRGASHGRPLRAPGELLLEARHEGFAALRLRAREVMGMPVSSRAAPHPSSCPVRVASEPMPVKRYFRKSGLRFSASNTTTQRKSGAPFQHTMTGSAVNGTSSKLVTGERRLRSPSRRHCPPVTLYGAEVPAALVRLVVNKSVRDKHPAAEP